MHGSATTLLATGVASLYATGLVAVGITMLARPRAWTDAVVRYTRWRWMHPVEILVCAGFGAAIWMAAAASAAPSLLSGFGALLVFVGVALALSPPSLHAAFAARAARRIEALNRLFGVLTLLFAGFLFYALHAPARAAAAAITGVN